MMFLKSTVLFIFYLLANGSIWFSNDDVDHVVSMNGLDVNLTWKIMGTDYKDSITITKDGYKFNSVFIKTMDPNHTIITLHLTDVQMDDSGTYRCTLGLWNTRYKDINLTIITDLDIEWDITPIKDRLAKDVTLKWRYKQITNKKTLSIYRKRTNHKEEKILSIFPGGSEKIKRGLSDVNITVKSEGITETVAFTIFNTTSEDFSYSYSLKLQFRETIYQQTEYIEIIEEINQYGRSFERMELVYVIPVLVLVIVVVVIAFLSALAFYRMKRPRQAENTEMTSNAANVVINNSYESLNSANIITDSNHSMVSDNDSSSQDLDPYLNPYNPTDRNETESDTHEYWQLKRCTENCEGGVINGDIEEPNTDRDTPSSHDSELYIHMYNRPTRTETDTSDKNEYTQLKQFTASRESDNDDGGVQETNNDSDGRSGDDIDSCDLSTDVGDDADRLVPVNIDNNISTESMDFQNPNDINSTYITPVFERY